MSRISLKELLKSNVHFGHKVKRWNPKMFPYIYTERNGIHIIDLVQTAQMLNDAYIFVKKASQERKRFLFLGTKRQAANIIAQEAIRSKSFYINQRWLGGMLTNWSTIKTRINRLNEIEQQNEKGLLEILPKQEVQKITKELNKLHKYLNGVKYMNKLPDIVVIVDQKKEIIAIKECIKLGIPTICILDTNCNPEIVNIPIPANDDAIRSIKLILSKISDAILEGKVF
uniref:Small ribosomal subunit protein uS2c n=1 Tax=Choreocolax polysiphoniae TaxID=282351 RepID=A0A0B5W3A4_9FLOR|nr:30S ribosomal protein S2 [Choreocolax polysiphoniae]AJH65870.1 30S ribosomal protein S2 [Choreocolax polysiphoniae]